MADVLLLAIFLLFSGVNGDTNESRSLDELIDFGGFSNVWHLLDTTMTNNSVTVTCVEMIKLEPIDPTLKLSFESTVTVESVNILSCEVPRNVSYAEIMLSSFNINVTAVKKLNLKFGDIESSILTGIQFSGLQIEELSVINEKSRMLLELSPDALAPLTKLKSLMIDRVSIGEIPESVKLHKIDLRRGRSLSKLGQCSDVQTLYLDSWTLFNDPDEWLGSNCRNISQLEINRVDLWTLMKLLGASRVSLRELSIHNCESVQIMSPYVPPLRKLEKLDVSHNGISANSLLDSDYITDGQQVHRVISAFGIPNLHELSLAHNNIGRFCENARSYSDIAKKLRKMSLAGIGLKDLCFGELPMYKLEYLNLTHNNITKVKIHELPHSYAHHIVIDLQDNPIEELLLPEINDYDEMRDNKSIFFTDMDYLALWYRTTILINKKLDCDCKNEFLGTALRERYISIEVAKCSDGRDLVQVPQEQLECHKEEQDGCTFRTRRRSTSTVANCSGGNIKTLPRKENLERIYASQNNIKTISQEDLPDTLRFLDLRKNRIARLDKNVSRIIFERGRTILLGDNEIPCDCDNRFFIEQLQTHHLQVEDYYNLTCVNIPKAIADVVPNDLCPLNMLPIILSISTIIAFAMLCIILCRIYGRDLKIFLFAHGVCLYFVSEEDVDSERCYDAFISFSHHDHDFIVDKLLTVLEPKYKICVHFRDWIVGEWIPTQVQRSVELSKRTIIVLSKNYLDSMWGMFEFRISHTSALKEGRSRIIVIVIDDVLESAHEIDPDLRHFVMNNTYLAWGDPWFWQKLRYTLPHKALGKDGTENLQLEEIKTCQETQTCLETIESTFE